MRRPETSPQTVDEMTVEWLDSILRSDAEGAHLSSFAAQPIGHGLLTTVVQVTLHWDDPGSGPNSVIVKLPSEHESNRAINRRFGYDRREVGAYRHLLGGLGPLTPSCHWAANTETGAIVVLDHLADHRTADQLAGANTADIDAVARAAADLHAGHWNDPSLRHHDFLPGPTSPEVADYEHHFTLTWPIFVEMIGDAATPARLGRAADAMERFGTVIERFAQAPITLVHGDLRLDNVLFEPGSGRAVLIDWQLAAWGRGAYDLAFFVAGSVEPASTEPAEKLIDDYHAALVGHGITGYTRSECWDDFRAGHVMNLPNPVTALVAVQTTDERAAELLRTNALRALRWAELLDL